MCVQIRSEGMLVALRLWGQLMTYNSPEQTNKAYCGVWEDAFAEVSGTFQDFILSCGSCGP